MHVSKIVTTRIDINRITNAFISRLTLDEIKNLDLTNAGITIFHGIVNGCLDGCKCSVRHEHYVQFDNDSTRYEFIKIPEKEPTYVIRAYDKKQSSYINCRVVIV